MAFAPRTFGAPLLAKDAKGRLISRIGTVFPHDRVVISERGIHATQRASYVDYLNRKRQEEGFAPLTRQEESYYWDSAVDLIMESDGVLIRPDPDNMPLAFEADALLQQLLPKHKIKFLCAQNEKVREAVKQRGESWRIAPLPTSPGEMKRMILASKIGIAGQDIYYYSKITGTRFLTYGEFSGLESLDNAQLAQHLSEIQQYSARLNHQGHPEIAFFMADRSFGKDDFAGCDFHQMDESWLRDVYQRLRQKFQAAVAQPYCEDDLELAEWRNRMFASLIRQKDETVTEEMLQGLSSEFFMQIRWLPGARIVDGELILDEVFEEPPSPGESPETRLYDENAREFIYNLVREYGDLDYVNIGRVVNRLSRRPQFRGRRDVYIAEIRPRGSKEEIVSIIRMQKWGVREHLDKNKSLLQAMFESEEYTEYVLDRRFACCQLGMNLPIRVTARKIAEKYIGPRTGSEGITIWSAYFERAYIRGIATDKMPHHRFVNEAFAMKFARLMGMAAAANIIVGRCDIEGNVLFDDGDEVVVEDASGMPVEIVVADQTGTFGSYAEELSFVAAAYAGPINRRVDWLSNPAEFARVYLDAFVERFFTIQHLYRSRKAGFHKLFRNRRYDKGGSFAYRWEQILNRLDRTDPRELTEVIRKNLLVRSEAPQAMQFQM